MNFLIKNIKQRYKLRDYRFSLVFLVITLSVIGIFMVGSARTDLMERQIMGVALGAAAMFVISMLDYLSKARHLLGFAPTDAKTHDAPGDAAEHPALEGEELENYWAQDLVWEITVGRVKIDAAARALEDANAAAREADDPQARCDAYRDEVLPAMDALRAPVDAMERICGADYWPVPTYNKMLFWV